MRYDIGSLLGRILYNVGQIAISQAHIQISDESTASKSPQSEQRSSPLLDHPVPSVSNQSQSASFNGLIQERFEAKEVRSCAGLSDKEKLTKYSRSRPSEDTQSQQQSKLTTLLSTSSSTAGRETLDQQRGFDTRTFYAGTAAYTQYGVAETFGPELQQPSANRSSAYPATIEDHDLQGRGAQASGESSMQPKPRTPRIEDAPLCPYHRSLLQDPHTNSGPGQGLVPMDRYVAEGPSERYAILHRPITGSMSTVSGCRCLELMQNSNNSDGDAQK